MYLRPRGCGGEELKKEKRGEAMASMREIHHGRGDTEERRVMGQNTECVSGEKKRALSGNFKR